MFYNKNLLHSEILLLRIKFTEYPLTIFFIHVTVRPLNENGTWQYKTEKEYNSFIIYLIKEGKKTENKDKKI